MDRKLVALLLGLSLLGFVLVQTQTVSSSFTAMDPGLRGGAPGAGTPFLDLTPNQLTFFNASRDEFQQLEAITEGLGPTMNLDSCAGCHSQPATGGTSPAVN